MNSKSFFSLFMLMFVLLMSSAASAAPTIVSPSPNSFGEIERITLNDPADVYSGGIIVVGGIEMILPKNLLIDLPANRLSLQQIFDQAPAACKTLGESGLAKADRCNGTGSGGIATLSATRTNAGNVIVGDIFIQKAAESVVGVVTYINYDQGYYRVNGITGDPATGAMVRLNDPLSRHTVQNGAGCAGGLNCSPDPRFNLDPDNYTNTFATGYPICIPSTVARSFTNLFGNGGVALSKANADGSGDFLCPSTNRTAALVEPPVADSRRFAPVMVGDSVVAEGNYESVGGVRFLSAHSSTVQKALSTRNVTGQPDYLFLEEVGYEAPPYQNQRLVALLIGFTTLAPTDVDVWSIHRDPALNAMHEFPFATVRGCDAVQGVGSCSSQGLVAAGANIFKVRYDIDFLKGVDPKLSPCAHLTSPASRFRTSGICSGGATTTNDIAVMSPVPHEIIARTGRKIDSATNPAIGELITIDVNGKPATNGEYLFPLGLNLGGLGVAEMSEVNINELNTPIPFEGITWNLDRRLGPSGCLNVGGCEGGNVGSAAFALDPFPFSGLDPRTQATLLPNGSYIDTLLSPTTLTTIRNRMFSYVDAGLGKFNGNNTVMPYALGTFPADPAFITILPTPILNMFPPIVVGDTTTTDTGVPVAIDVLVNDVPVFGTIDPTSVLIATGPASGTVLVNPTTGAITYTPADPLVSTVSFTYTVANNFGSRSLPGTVTVTISAPPPVANNDAATTPAGMSIFVNVIANDTIAVGTINPASLSVNAATGGFAAANIGGTVTYTAPATPGTYTFTYTVKNNAVSPATSNVATVTVTVTQSAPASAVTLVSSPASPQNPGASVSFVAAASGGSGNYEYRFWRKIGAVWSVVRNYSTTTTWTWDTTGVTPGTYGIQVDVRNVGSTATSEAAKSIAYTLAAPSAPASAVTLAPALASPQVPGASITFVAAGSGGSGNYEYRFLSKIGTVWTVVQNYSPVATWTWNTTGAAPGLYGVQVDVRNVGSTTATFETAKAIVYSLAAPSAPASAVTLAPALASPQVPGASITFVAAGSGGSGNYEYRFLSKIGTVWTVVQNYSPVATWTWNTTGAAPGLYGVQVDVRNVGSTALPSEAAKSIGYTIQ